MLTARLKRGRYPEFVRAQDIGCLVSQLGSPDSAVLTVYASQETASNAGSREIAVWLHYNLHGLSHEMGLKVNRSVAAYVFDMLSYRPRDTLERNANSNF